MRFIIIALLAFALCSIDAVASTEVYFTPTIEKAQIFDGNAEIFSARLSAQNADSAKGSTILNGPDTVVLPKWPWNPPPVPTSIDPGLRCNPCFALNGLIRLQPG